MGSLKKYCSLRASSLLESVIALAIISICLYIAILIFAAVFTPRTSAKFYSTQNKLDEVFFLAQVSGDSLLAGTDEYFQYEEEIINDGLKEITVHYRDSANVSYQRKFYVQN